MGIVKRFETQMCLQKIIHYENMQKMCEQKLSKEEINRYKRAFAIFDVEGEGTITTEVITFLSIIQSIQISCILII